MTRLLAALAMTAALLGGAPAQAQVEVDLALVLAVDISRSVDDEEARLQREGYMAALTDPRVINAIQSGATGQIALAYVEWAGAEFQRTVVDWRIVRDGEDAAEFAALIDAAPRLSAGWTSVSGAIDYSVQVLARCPCTPLRRVIDVSGDGSNNSGRPARMARDDAVDAGIVINGLPILNDRPNFSRPAEANLDAFYEREVIGGPGGFMIPAEDFHAFASAILTKLIREISALPTE